MTYSGLADLVVLVHLAFVCFVLFGLIAIVAGMLWDWMWPRNFLFRLVLLASTACVATEALLGVTCPLTTLENHLLLAAGKSAYNRSFIGNVTHGVLFYDAPEWVFTIIYWLLTLFILGNFILVPPYRRGKVKEMARSGISEMR